MKTPITYYGGKQTLLPHILPRIPVHDLYTEAFAGGLAVFFAKPPSKVEVVNDTNAELINFYRVLKTRYNELKLRVDATLHSRLTHEYATFVYNHAEIFNEIERAWAVWCLTKQSFASRLDAVWGYDFKKGTKPIAISNAKGNFTNELSARLEFVQIECDDALNVLKRYDSPDTFHFIDSPYIGSDMGHYAGYTEHDFESLLELCSQLEGKFMLTMFPHSILASHIAKNNWNVYEIERTISAAKTKRRKQTELIVTNYK